MTIPCAGEERQPEAEHAAKVWQFLRKQLVDSQHVPQHFFEDVSTSPQDFMSECLEWLTQPEVGETQVSVKGESHTMEYYLAVKRSNQWVGKVTVPWMGCQTCCCVKETRPHSCLFLWNFGAGADEVQEQKSRGLLVAGAGKDCKASPWKAE